VVADILAHAREEAPHECCGLLVGRADAVVRAVRARNLSGVQTRYLVDPRDHFRALRSARADHLEVVGAYHSHPASSPVPSETDVSDAASGPEFLYLIVSLLNDDVRAYRIDRGEVVACVLRRIA
jgi:[CysO sulfur-carrier protein]-S-L-cysteine hydrolase